MNEKVKQARSEKTVTQFLDAAEAHFATYGYEGARIRSIAKEANVQLGVLHYYWGSKETLFAAVAERRLREACDERLRRLEFCVAASGGNPDLRAVLTAYIEPMAAASVGHPVFDQLILRTLTDPAPEVRRAFESIFDKGLFRFVEIVRKCCSDVDDGTFYWRLGVAMGAMQHFLTSRASLSRVSGGKFDPEADFQSGVKELINALLIVMTAPAK